MPLVNVCESEDGGVGTSAETIFDLVDDLHFWLLTQRFLPDTRQLAVQR
jgi:hypothetical protein